MRNKKLIVLFAVVMVLVLSVVTCGATFLVRNVDAYGYYENAQSDIYDKNVVSASGIKKNSSIFFLDETAVKNRVEKAYPNIGVVNIKRSFPDRVTINYVLYEKLFQYKNGDRYYRCYSSGRIGETAAQSAGGYVTVIPKGVTSTEIGDYFQSKNGSDRQYIDAFVKFMRRKGMIDLQIIQNVKFIDLSRDGYVYIRMSAGCSIELHGGVSDFDRLMERGWAIFYPGGGSGSDPIERSSGLITVTVNRSEGAADPIRSTYVKPGVEYIGGKPYTDEGYYNDHYVLPSP